MRKKDDDSIPLMPAGSARLPTTQLRQLSEAAPPINDPLHLIHITAAGWAAEILRSPIPQIEMRECGVFKRSLAYFFVARAAFRPRRGDVGTDDLTRFPVAFVIDPERLGTPAHVYPFDTGAAATGWYAGAHQDGVFLQDYALSPDMDAVRRLIGWAFTTYSAYLDGQLDPGLEGRFAGTHYVAYKYLRIARLAGIGANQPDLRASAIEVAYNRHVPLAAHARLVVLPEQLLEASEGGKTIGQRLVDLNVPFQTYRWIPGETPDRHMEEVRRLVAAEVRSTIVP